MEKIAEDIFYEASFRGVNLGLVSTSEGVVLVNVPMLPMVAAEWRKACEAHGTIQFILNTDHLQEHTMGNFFIPGDLIGHHETRSRMRMTDRAKETYIKFVIENDQQGAAEAVRNYDLRYPNIELFDELTIFLGGRKLRFIHLPGPTSNSVGLYVADEKVLFTGDVVMNNYRPYLGLASIEEWLATLSRIEQMDVELIVPGQGKPLGLEGLPPMAHYLQTMHQRVQWLIEEGRTRDEVVSRMMPFFEEWPIDNTRRDEERNLYRQGVRQLFDTITGRK